jgi:hypothetical protein
MLQQPNQEQGPIKPIVYGFIQKTSRRIMAIGASLRTWLRAVDLIVFSPEPAHQPDAKLIAELVEILLAGERPKFDD